MAICFILAVTIVTYNTNFNREEEQQPRKLELTNKNCDKYNLSEQDEISECQDIHIAMVVGGYNSTRGFYVLLKSILFYRTDIIHLHLFVDNIAHQILVSLFRGWIVPDLHVIYYNISTYEHEITWLTNVHYSGHYGLMKLILLDVLSKKADTIDKLIILDTDMLVLGDISTIWSEFNNFNDKQELGLVENQSRWYLGETKNSKLEQSDYDDELADHRRETIGSGGAKAWPALGRGFNSGSMLANLFRLREQNWTSSWRQIAESELTSYLSTTLADQDIINSYIKSKPNSVYKLSCHYNTQLNDHAMNMDSEGGYCSQRPGQIRILHWNSPYKLATKNKEAQVYKNWYLTFLNWDGSLLMQSVCSHENSEPKDRVVETATTITIPSCKDIRPGPQDPLRTYLYFLNFELDKLDEPFDVTICVQLSLDRLQTLDELALHWRGPISAAIYLSELESNLLMASIENSNNLASRRNIGYHLVFRDHGFNYPINRLRNIALANALTPYVFLSDIDFLPSYNLYDYLRQVIGDMVQSERFARNPPLSNAALVVPAFENLQYKFEFPLSKNELLSQLNLGIVSMFREQIWPLGHAPTDYNKWRVATQVYQVNWQPEYEPLVVIDRKEVPKFDERFVGFGWNKVEHIMELAAKKYKFLVLPDAFTIHKLHAASYDILQHRESQKYRTCIRQLRRNFLLDLKLKYPSFFESVNSTVTSASQSFTTNSTASKTNDTNATTTTTTTTTSTTSSSVENFEEET